MAWCSEVYSRGGLTEEYCRGVWGIHGKACLT